jgi:NADPH2:quinone reductase
MRAILLKKNTDSVKMHDIDAPSKMSKSDVFIKHTYVNVNFDDYLIKDGKIAISSKLQPIDDKYYTMGFSGVGVVKKTGTDINGFHEGSRLCYPFAPLGAFTEYRVLNANFCCALPDFIQDDIACALARVGVAAQYLLLRCFVPKKGYTVMISGVGSGVGNILLQWAKHFELKVIGLVSSNTSAEVAKQDGCDLVINKSDLEATKKILDFTHNNGVACFYDGMGKDVMEIGIKALSVFGSYINYGSTTGEIDFLDTRLLEAKSLFFTRPRIEMYKNNRQELILSINEVFNAYKNGIIKPKIKKYKFENIPSIIDDMSHNKTKSIIVAEVGH